MESELRWLPEMCKQPRKDRKKHRSKAKQNNKTLMSQLKFSADHSKYSGIQISAKQH